MALVLESWILLHSTIVRLANPMSPTFAAHGFERSLEATTLSSDGAIPTLSPPMKIVPCPAFVIVFRATRFRLEPSAIQMQSPELAFASPQREIMLFSSRLSLL